MNMFNIIFYIFIFLFGLVVGSFLNCIIYRLEKGQGFLFSRSYCPHCKHVLGWKDLIPILSFIILRGKCRYCQKPISIQYPAVEIATALSFLISYFLFLIHFLFLIFYLVIFCFLIIIFVYDLKHYIIPDKVIYPAIGLALVFVILNAVKDPVAPALTTGFLASPSPSFALQNWGWASLGMTILSAFGAAAFFLAIVLISRGKWMGVGDIKLAFLMGLFLGWPNILVALFVAFLLGAVVGLGLIVLGKKTLKSEVPFGPFLVSGTLLALFFGQSIIHWYVNLFLL